MSIERDSARDDVSSISRFVTTHWSVVLLAKEGSTRDADVALEQLCRVYWWPLYAFVRRRGCRVHDAQDSIQEFFARLLAKDSLRTVDRTKGRFRSFLLASLEHFLANEWRNAHTLKRGGEFTFVSADSDAEQQYLQLPASELSPEQLFKQQWAMTLLNQTVDRLREEFVAAGKKAQFEQIKIFLTGEKQATSYAELALKLEITEAALKMCVSRMRQRYGELLRAEIAETVSGPEEINEELRALLGALSF
jgi:RNA polymerase sigma factor (sigma-70 family)